MSLTDKNNAYMLTLKNRRFVRLFFPWAIIGWSFIVFSSGFIFNRLSVWNILLLLFLFFIVNILNILFEMMSAKSIINQMVSQFKKSEVEINDKTTEFLYNYKPTEVYSQRKKLRWKVLTLLSIILPLFGLINTISIHKSTFVFLTYLLITLIPYSVLCEELYTYRPFSYKQIRFFLIGFFPLYIVGIVLITYFILINEIPGFNGLFDAGLFLLSYLIILSSVFINARIKVSESSVRNSMSKIVDLTQSSNEESNYSIPEFIFDKFRYERISILTKMPENKGDENSQLFISAIFPNNNNTIGQAIGLRSITCKAFETGKYVLWNDINYCPYFESGGHFDPINITRSELAVPIIHDGVKIGVLDVQSGDYGAFGPTDIKILRSISALLGNYYYYQAYLDKFSEINQRSLDYVHKQINEDIDDYDLIIKHINPLIEFGVIKNLEYIKLSPTGFPISVYPVDIHIKNIDLGPLKQKIKNWQIINITPKEDLINLVVCLGDSNIKLGLLEVDIDRTLYNNPLIPSIIRFFIYTTNMLLWYKRYNEVILRSFESIEVQFHDIQKFYRVCVENMNSLEEKLKKYENFMDDVEDIEKRKAPDFRDNKNVLKDKIDYVLNQMGYSEIKMKNCEKLSKNWWLSLIIYRVVIEAACNARTHGKSQPGNLSVRIELEDDMVDGTENLCIHISNHSFSDKSFYEIRNKRTGMTFLKQALKKHFSAEVNFTEDNGITNLSVRIPVLI
jgi:hypothetical protein